MTSIDSSSGSHTLASPTRPRLGGEAHPPGCRRSVHDGPRLRRVAVSRSRRRLRAKSRVVIQLDDTSTIRALVQFDRVRLVPGRQRSRRPTPPMLYFEPGKVKPQLDERPAGAESSSSRSSSTTPATCDSGRQSTAAPGSSRSPSPSQTTAPPAIMPVQLRVHLEASARSSLRPGWYLNPGDRASSRSSPEPASSLNTALVVAPVLDQVIRFAGDPVGGGRGGVDRAQRLLRSATPPRPVRTSSLRSPADSSAIKLGQRAALRDRGLHDRRGGRVRDLAAPGLHRQRDPPQRDHRDGDRRHPALRRIASTTASVRPAARYRRARAGRRTSSRSTTSTRRASCVVQSAGINLGSRAVSRRPSASAMRSSATTSTTCRGQGVFGFRFQGGNIIAYNDVHDVTLPRPRTRARSTSR